MNNSKPIRVRFWITLASTCLVATVAGSPAMAQDKAKPAAAPAKAAQKDERDRKVLVDNDKVLVSEVKYKVGASSGMVERKQRVVRALTDGTLEKTMPDGKKEVITWKAGETRFNPKETYSQKNIGKTDLVLFTVSLK